MKIIRIIARLNVGGPARHVVWLTAGMKDVGYDTLLVAGVVPPGEDDMSYLAAQHGVSPLILPEMSREISPKDAVTIWRLFRLMLREKPDLVHTHTAKAGTVGRVAGFMYRWFTPATLIGRPRQCRFVHTYHGHVFHSYYGRAKTRLFLNIERTLARLVTDRVVVITEQQRREINEQFRVGKAKQFAVIPLGIDLDVYADWPSRRARVRVEFGAPNDEIWIGIVGRLTEIKNHEMFLRAAHLLKKSDSRRMKFVIVGDGHLRLQLERQADALGLRDDVRFLGSRHDPENFYPALDVLALTSLNEGTPLSVIEAMANARPVIATMVGGVVDLLGQPQGDAPGGFIVRERGISVPSGDAESFARGLAHLIHHDGFRQELGERGRAFVYERFAKQRLLADMAALYAELLPSHAEPATQRSEAGASDYHVRLTHRT
ncbi:MAG TPA: glycosyltransferase [Pyrinomonadaceae bacterium]|jgi:glycosyltransferase involved in cell wall biosynthesis|nr:glycosyltransferase [Pyrinomonadaceae bacterium]